MSLPSYIQDTINFICIIDGLHIPTHLNFTMNHSHQSVTFLDVEIHTNIDGSLSSALFRKRTSGNSILHATSSHQRSLVTSIPYSQYLRVRCNCYNKISLKNEAEKLKQRLLMHRYSIASLKKAYKRTIQKTRQNLLYGQKKRKPTNTLCIITRFSQQHTQISKIVTKYWHLLTMDPNAGPFVPQTLTFYFRRTTSIKDRVVQSKYKGFNRHDIRVWRLQIL